MSDIVVYGASEHGKYTIDIVERAGEHSVVGLIDDAAAPGTEVYGYRVLGSGHELISLQDEYGFVGGVVAVGDNYVRSRIVDRVSQIAPDFEFVTAIHPFTSIGREVSVGAGTVMMAGVVVNGSSSVGRHCFLATNSSLDHDSTMSDFSSLSPGVATGGNVQLGAYSAISIGACVLHGVSVGAHSVVGAGSTVTRDLPEHVVAYGTPCRVVRPRKPGDRYL